MRRVGGKRLDDEEMITHYLSLVEKYGQSGELRGTFVKEVAFVYQGEVQSFESFSPRLFVNRQSPMIDEGYPLASIQIVPALNKFKSELTREEEAVTMDIEQQSIFDFLFREIQRLSAK